MKQFFYLFKSKKKLLLFSIYFIVVITGIFIRRKGNPESSGTAYDHRVQRGCGKACKIPETDSAECTACCNDRDGTV